MRSRSGAREAPDHAPIALGGPAMRVMRRMRPGAAHGDHVLAPRPVLVALLIQQRGLGRRTALQRHAAHFHLPVQLPRAQLDLVAHLDFLSRLHALAVELHLAALHRPRGQAARLVEARRPQPLVDAQTPGRAVCVARRCHARTPATLATEAPAVLRRSLPGLLVDATVLEYERALAADRLAAAGSEHDAGADAYSAASAAADPEADRGASPRAHAVGHPCVHVAAVAELRAARGCAPAQHHLVVSRAVPAAPRFGKLAARGGTAGKQNDHQRCDPHRVLQGNENAPKISPRGAVLL